MHLAGWLAGYLGIFLCLVVGFRPRFHSGYLTPSGISCLKMQTTLRWPHWKHWKFALIQWPHGNMQNRFQASPKLLGKRKACALHFRELQKNSHRLRGCTSAVCWVGIILPDSQDARILEYARRSKASKALPLDNLSGAVSAYYQRQTEPVVLDSIKNVETTDPKT